MTKHSQVIRKHIYICPLKLIRTCSTPSQKQIKLNLPSGNKRCVVHKREIARGREFRFVENIPSKSLSIDNLKQWFSSHIGLTLILIGTRIKIVCDIRYQSPPSHDHKYIVKTQRRAHTHTCTSPSISSQFSFITTRSRFRIIFYDTQNFKQEKYI